MTTTNRPTVTSRLSLIVSAAAVSALILGPLLSGSGFIAPMRGFLLFIAALPLALLAIFFGALGAYTTRSSTGRRGAGSAWFAMIAGLLILLIVGGLAMNASSAPKIHDITTDLNDPPVFEAIMEEPANAGIDLTYPHGNPRTPEIQRLTFPTLSSLRLQRHPEVTLSQIHDIANDLGWRFVQTSHILYSPNQLSAQQTVAAEQTTPEANIPTEQTVAEPASDHQQPTHIETVFEATDASLFFGFVDDIVVRVRGPVSPDDARSTIDIRSKSRDGESDIGVNAARILEFQEALKKASSNGSTP